MFTRPPVGTRGKLWALSKASLHGKDKQHLLQMPPLNKAKPGMTDVHQVGPCGVIIHHPMYPPSIPSYHPRHATIKPKNKEDGRQHLGFDISHLLSLITAKIYIFSSKMVGFVTNSPPRAVVQRCSFLLFYCLCLKAILIICLKF